MSIPDLTGIDAELARQVCERFPLDSSILCLAAPEMEPSAFVEVLLSNGHYGESVHFLSHGMTKRKAIRWAHLCVASMEAAGAEPDIAMALSIVSDWLELGDGEENEERLAELRASAGELAEKLELEPASAWLAAAVSNSVAPEGEEDEAVLYEPMSQSQAVVAILLAVSEVNQSFVQDQSEQYLGYLQEFLSRGVDLAAGGPGVADKETLAFYFPETASSCEIKVGPPVDE